MSPRKAARFSLGTLIWFKSNSWEDKKHVGTIIGTWTWSANPVPRATKIKSYGTDPRSDSYSNGYLILPSDPSIETNYAFYADVTLGNIGTLGTKEKQQ